MIEIIAIAIGAIGLSIATLISIRAIANYYRDRAMDSYLREAKPPRRGEVDWNELLEERGSYE